VHRTVIHDGLQNVSRKVYGDMIGSDKRLATKPKITGIPRYARHDQGKEMTIEDEIEDALPGATRLREKRSLHRFRNHSIVKGNVRSCILSVRP